MNRFISPRGSSRIRRVLVVLLFCCSLLPLRVLVAQGPTGPTSAPPFTRTADEVNKEGYKLTPLGMATNKWPALEIDFTIDRADHTIFKNLTIPDIETKIDGRPVVVRDGDLREKDSQGVFVLLDGSGSMASTGGVDKLSAAKQGVKTFVDALKADEKVGLIVFDEEQRVIVPPTTDRVALKQEIDSFTIRRDKSRYTRLYDAVVYGLEQAKANGVKNLLLISDGWEDTPETRSLSAQGIETLKRDREQKITSLSRNDYIRIFTVAIGDEHGKGLNYVDRNALDNISKGANGGVAAYIELKGDAGSQSVDQSVLQSGLQQILHDVERWFQYSYVLTVRVDDSLQPSIGEHKLWVAFTVGDSPRIQLPIEYTYAMQPTGGAPVVTKTAIQPAIFIRAAPRTVTWQQLLFIYLVLLTTLVVLALLPSVFQTLWRGVQSVRLRKALVRLDGRSPFVGVACPNEGTASGRAYLFKEGDILLVCPNCDTPHHLSCWIFSDNQCMQRNCATELIIPAAMLERHGLVERELGEETSWMTS